MELHETLQWLCDLRSSSGEEQAVADRLHQVLTALPSKPVISRHGNSLVVRLSPGAGGSRILLVGQLDVADAGQPQPARVEGGRLWGAGAADAKSGVALMLDLAERPLNPELDLTLVFHAGGERGLDGSELGRVIKEEPDLLTSDFALVLRPTDNKLQLGCGGATQATLAFRGRTAHSGLPGAGANAIHHFAMVLVRLASFRPVADVVDDLTWHETMAATSIQGGRPGAIVPDSLVVNVHHTFGPSTSSHDSQDRLMALVDGIGSVRFEELSPAAAPNRKHPFIASLEAGGVSVEARQTWTEVARFAAHGMAAATFGPGSQLAAHARDESIDLAELERGRNTLVGWLASNAPTMPAQPRR